jgi:succinate dehydrogenase / fumarate reductase cytochrome b subunit
MSAASAVAVRLAAPATFGWSTVGRKVIMAVTGFILFGFILAHLTGNLLLYRGPEAMHSYAVFLRSFLHGTGLWAARTGLIISAVLHVWSATSLTLQSWAARPVGYRRWTARDSTYASRTMRWSGVILLAFIIYHLLHFTFGTVHPDFQELQPYHNVVAGFRVLPVSLFYIVAMVLLGLHLDHGVWSMLRTLGLSHPRYARWARLAAAGFAIVVVVGNISFPIAVLAGWVQ